MKKEEQAEVLEDPVLEQLLNRRQELAPLRKEADRIERELKARLHKGRNIICGVHLVKWIRGTRKKEVVIPPGVFYRMMVVPALTVGLAKKVEQQLHVA